METIYIKGDSLAFKAFVDEHYKDNTISLRNIDGHNRWVVTNDDGTEFIARPWEANPNK
jgi:hypothetical protein